MPAGDVFTFRGLGVSRRHRLSTSYLSFTTGHACAPHTYVRAPGKARMLHVADTSRSVSLQMTSAKNDRPTRFVHFIGSDRKAVGVI